MPLFEIRRMNETLRIYFDENILFLETWKDRRDMNGPLRLSTVKKKKNLLVD